MAIQMVKITPRQSQIRHAIYNAYLYSNAMVVRNPVWKPGSEKFRQDYKAEGYTITPEKLDSVREVIKQWLTCELGQFPGGYMEYREIAIRNAMLARHLMCEELGVPNE